MKLDQDRARRQLERDELADHGNVVTVSIGIDSSRFEENLKRLNEVIRYSANQRELIDVLRPVACGECGQIKSFHPQVRHVMEAKR